MSRRCSRLSSASNSRRRSIPIRPREECRHSAIFYCFGRCSASSRCRRPSMRYTNCVGAKLSGAYFHACLVFAATGPILALLMRGLGRIRFAGLWFFRAAPRVGDARALSCVPHFRLRRAKRARARLAAGVGGARSRRGRLRAVLSRRGRPLARVTAPSFSRLGEKEGAAALTPCRALGDFAFQPFPWVDGARRRPFDEGVGAFPGEPAGFRRHIRPRGRTMATRHCRAGFSPASRRRHRRRSA